MAVIIIILALVVLLIAVRQVGRLRLQIWQIMLFGALSALLSGGISPIGALKSIDVDVMLFLFGMFVVGEALEESGYLSSLSYRFFKKAVSADLLVLFILFGMGFASAFLMNDTLAIIGTPVVLLLAKKHRMSPKLLLLSLAFAVTIGSTVSPIGSPQNLLIAINGNVANPFVTFFRLLLAPTLVNLFLAYILLRLFYKAHFNNNSLDHSPEFVIEPRLAGVSKLSLVVLILLVFAKVASVLLGLEIDFKLPYIALASALPILLLSPKRYGIVRRIDWHTLIFFAAMFVLMQSVWNSGVFQALITGMDLNITSIETVLIVSVLLSQVLSNVPLVALYLPVLLHAGAKTKGLVALAAGSTIAGNLSILGAASNIIIIQNAEKRTGDTLTFFEFARVGVPLSILNVFVYWVFLEVI